jgi:hypothetical protein
VDAVCYSDRPGRRWNKPSYSSLLDVIAVRVNTAVPDSLFTFAFPPGTRVVDMIRRRNYRVGEVYEELDVCPFEVKTPA